MHQSNSSIDKQIDGIRTFRTLERHLKLKPYDFRMLTQPPENTRTKSDNLHVCGREERGNSRARTQSHKLVFLMEEKTKITNSEIDVEE